MKITKKLIEALVLEELQAPSDPATQASDEEKFWDLQVEAAMTFINEANPPDVEAGLQKFGKYLQQKGMGSLSIEEIVNGVRERLGNQTNSLEETAAEGSDQFQGDMETGQGEEVEDFSRLDSMKAGIAKEVQEFVQSLEQVSTPEDLSALIINFKDVIGAYDPNRKPV